MIVAVAGADAVIGMVDVVVETVVAQMVDVVVETAASVVVDPIEMEVVVMEVEAGAAKVVVLVGINRVVHGHGLCPPCRAPWFRLGRSLVIEPPPMNKRAARPV